MIENVFDSDEHISVRCAIPGSVAKYVCRCGANTMCSYTSSVSTNTSNSSANAAIWSNSSRVNTRPHGFDGLHRMNAFSPLANALRNSAGSNR